MAVQANDPSGFLRDDHRPAVIIAAIGTGTMRQLLLVAIGTFGRARGHGFVVRTAFSTARFRMASFRIWHATIPPKT